MSLYCKGTVCPKSQQCRRAKAYRDLVTDDPGVEERSILEFPANGLWLVDMQDCIRHDFVDGVF